MIRNALVEETKKVCKNTPKPSGNYTSYYKEYKKAYKRNESIFTRLYCHLVGDYRYLCKSELSYMIKIRRLKENDLQALAIGLTLEYGLQFDKSYDPKHKLYSAIKWDLSRKQCKELYEDIKEYCLKD